MKKQRTGITERQLPLYGLLADVSGSSIWAQVIQWYYHHKNERSLEFQRALFDNLLRQLYSQYQNNEMMMEEIIGSKATKELVKYFTQTKKQKS